MRRRAVGLFLVLSLCGCRGGLRDVGPAHVVLRVGGDAFHGCLIVPAEADAQLAGSMPPGTREVQIGFGDRAWMLEDSSLRHASRLVFVPDTGAVTIEAHDAELDEGDGVMRTWRIPLTRAGWEGLRARFETWIDWGVQGPIARGQRFYGARRSFSAWNCCHDFVADLLDAAGVPIGARPFRTEAVLESQVRAALRRLERGGARAFGPPPAVAR